LNRNIKKITALIELPSWLGDCVMSTPAIENIINYYVDIDITVIGPSSSIELFKNHPKVVNFVSLDSKSKYTFTNLSKLGFFDLYFTFRSSVRAKIFKLLINASNKFQFNNRNFKNRHQVEKYVDFINDSLNIRYSAGNLISNFEKPKEKSKSKILGINPGASYGSAKRWYPEKFAKVAIELSDNFDILIFGSRNEIEFTKIIEKYLLQNNIYNFINLAGKTSISELVKHISNLDIFLTGDSGPMHIAASLQIPTVALFGPTNHIETSQWKNPNSFIIKKNLSCQPCMKRTCPLGHHNCMKLIDSEEVIDLVHKNLTNN